ncbi:MAG: hypothetical protein JWN76_3411 [Chitinophagaceae bacterium]|nr:hypothetical protein [Chitinophagaceae bacterium]
MILMNKSLLYILLVICYLSSSCGVYTFRDITIPPEVKTIKIFTIENRAPIRNPLLSSRITNQLQQKISNQTRLARTNNDDAHYQVSGYITNYNPSTVSISNQRAATNRLTVAIHIIFRNTLQNKTQEFDVSRDFDFSANLSFNQAEGNLMDEIVKNMTDEIFNRIFSNW